MTLPPHAIGRPGVSQAAFSGRDQAPNDQTARRGRSELVPLFALIPDVVVTPRRPALEVKRSKLEQLQELERELSVLLASSTPQTWREMRRALWRLIRRARRELRAAERVNIA